MEIDREARKLYDDSEGNPPETFSYQQKPHSGATRQQKPPSYTPSAPLSDSKVNRGQV